MVELLTRYLQPISSKIDSAAELEDGLKLSDTERYNLILLDLRLGKTGKEEALEAIKHFKAHASAVIVVSGSYEPNIKEEALAKGADAFVAKDGTPLSQAMLLASYAATLNLPMESKRSDSFVEHVELLRRMVTEKP